jgi:hypothetical protein
VADDLPPTQYLVMEVLAARYRLGETLWPFPTTVAPALRVLNDAGLIELMDGNIAHTVRASLTDEGIRASVSANVQPAAPDARPGHRHPAGHQRRHVHLGQRPRARTVRGVRGGHQRHLP